MWSSAEKLTERIKRTNKRMLIGLFLMVIFAVIWILIGFPAAAGAFSVVIEQGKGLSPTAGIGLALLATALSGVVSWLYQHSTAQNRNTDAPVVGGIGKLLLLSGFLLTLFALLAPFVPEPQTGYIWWNTLIKWVCASGLILGSFTLVMGVLLGILESAGLISAVRNLFQRQLSD